MTAISPRLKVFVVEDESLITMTIDDVIETLGYEIVGPVAELAEAMAVAERGEFDCALLDINIRGGNTYGIAELLRARGCPFVVATGYGGQSMPIHLRDERRLAKPYSTRELETELRWLKAKVQLKWDAEPDGTLGSAMDR